MAEAEVKKEGAVVAGAVVAGAVVEQAKRKELTEEQKKALKDKEKAKKEAYKKGAQDMLKLIQDHKLDGKVSKEGFVFLNHFAGIDTTATKGSTFAALFGGAPKVGQSITLKEAMEKTLKGQGVLNAYLKVWEKKGIVVAYTADSKEPLKSTYTIKALPQG